MPGAPPPFLPVPLLPPPSSTMRLPRPGERFGAPWGLNEKPHRLHSHAVPPSRIAFRVSKE
eukprot:8705791-Pyramimonas_sp.AAC.1